MIGDMVMHGRRTKYISPVDYFILLIYSNSNTNVFNITTLLI